MDHWEIISNSGDPLMVIIKVVFSEMETSKMATTFYILKGTLLWFKGAP